MNIDARTQGPEIRENADVIIVGSGAGGAPMAYELAKAGWNVVLFEEGRRFEVDEFKRDSWQATRQMYRDASMSATLGTPPVPLPLGMTLGGTTTVNSGTCFRTPEKLFQRWKGAFGLGTLEYADLLPHFESVEEMINVVDTPYELMAGNNTLFAEGARKLGLHGAPLKRNQRNCKGAGLCAFGCPNQAKQSMSLNYLPEASRLGARIYTSTRIHEVHVEKGAATGVTGIIVDEKREKVGTVHADAPVVIMACGTIHTPFVLLKNKLANRSGMVGKNLRLHPASKVVGVFDEPVEAWSGVPQSYYVDEYQDDGLTFEGFFIPPAFLAFALPALGMRLKEYMAEYNKLAGFGIMVSDTSAGSVRVAPGGKNPLMLYNLNKQDTRTFVKGIDIASRVYLAAGARKVLPPVFGMDAFHSTADVDRLASAKVRAADLELIAFHPMGTCRMGDDPGNSVVNADLESHDVRGLFVADGSIFPSSLGVNPQLSIMTFSRHAAHQLIRNREKFLAPVAPV